MHTFPMRGNRWDPCPHLCDTSYPLPLHRQSEFARPSLSCQTSSESPKLLEDHTHGRSRTRARRVVRGARVCVCVCVCVCV